MKSPTRFYLDEHISNAVAERLHRHGIDVLTLVEADKLGTDDEEYKRYTSILDSDRILYLIFQILIYFLAQ